jgi:uncharacterized protein (TIGR02231 family)
MRKLFALSAIFYLVVFTGVTSAESVEADSKVAAVTVYPGVASVTRRVTISLSVGAHSILFKDIIPQFDEPSLTVTGKGEAEVKIFGAYVKTDQLKEVADKRVRELEQKIADLGDEVITQNNAAIVLQKERQYLDSVILFSGQQIPKDLVTTMPSPDQLKAVQGFLNSNYSDINARQEGVTKKLRDLQREIDSLTRELAEIRGGAGKSQRSIVVDLECVKPGSLSLDVSYLVHGAGWHPRYDARTRDLEGKVDLTAFGVISQTTGEDWIDVVLTLSTAQPMINGRMPYIAPRVLNMGNNPVSVRKSRLRSASDDIGEQYEAFTVQTQAFSGGVAEESRLPEERPADLALAEVASKGVAVTYKIVRSATVKSDGVEATFPVSSQVLSADFEYSTFPQAVPYVYFGSRVKNAEDLQLLAGSINLFLDKDYVGKSSLDNTGPGEEFDLYLGVDENVKIERKEIERKTDDVLIAGIPSPSIKVTVKYRLTVENYKNRDIKVKLFEAMPVAGNDRIKVSIRDVSMEPQVKDWKDRKGVWLWELKLKPAQKQEITYTQIVEYPKDSIVTGF